VGLALGTQILASVAGDASSSHSNHLIEHIETILRDAGRELREVDLFAAAIGPGSFTGLRIGLATAKSLAMSMGRKCAGVSTLAAVAVAAGESTRTVALLPAGRGEVFAQMLTVKDGSVDALDSATHIAPELLPVRYGEFRTLLWAGEGAHLQIEMLSEQAKARGISVQSSGLPAMTTDGWIVAPPHNKLADAVAKLALGEWRAGSVVDPQDLHANYLRASDAEIKNNG
jgi:tRNA threonylcarbamoyladenosine biosynthesis protein TsaB